MTTLKDVLFKRRSELTYFSNLQISQCVKEWLEQKRLEHLKKTVVIDHFEIVDELLEELK